MYLNRRLNTAIRLLRSRKFKIFFRKVFLFPVLYLKKKKQRISYKKWRQIWVELSPEEKVRVTESLESLSHRPSFTVLLSADEKDSSALFSTIKSVASQLYPNWVLHVTSQGALELPFSEKVLALDDSRIRLTGPTPTALGGWVVELASGVLLHEAALYHFAFSIVENPEIAIVYSDHDHVAVSGAFRDPHMKPDWNPDLFAAMNYLEPLVACKKEPWETLRDKAPGQYEFLLESTKTLPRKTIFHIPRVLASVQISDNSDHLEPTCERIIYDIPSPAPKVSILIPTRDQGSLLKKCLESLYEKTDYKDFEIVLVDHETIEQKALEVIENFRVKSNFKVLNFSGSFNFSATMNRAAEIADGQILILLNNDTEVFDPSWLGELVSQVSRPEVGVAGALLLFGDKTIQHAGVHPGLNGLMGHGHKHLPSDDSGYFSRLKTVHEVAAVTGACLAIEKKIWVDVGGLDEELLPVAYNDIDLCLKVREKNLRVIFSPYAKLFHHESVSRGVDEPVENNKRLQDEIRIMKERWGDLLFHDPAYSPNLSKEDGSFKLSNNPVSLKTC